MTTTPRTSRSCASAGSMTVRPRTIRSPLGADALRVKSELASGAGLSLLLCPSSRAMAIASCCEKRPRSFTTYRVESIPLYSPGNDSAMMICPAFPHPCANEQYPCPRRVPKHDQGAESAIHGSPRPGSASLSSHYLGDVLDQVNLNGLIQAMMRTRARFVCVLDPAELS